MRSRRLGPAQGFVVVAVAASLMLVGAPSPGRTATPPSVIDTTVTVQAGQSASVLLELKAPVAYALSQDDTSDLKVEGHGRAVAAVLQPTDSLKPTEAVIVARFNGCDHPGCRAEPGAEPFVYTREATGNPRAPDGRATLEAGTYRLSILTDGSPATVTLQLGQPAGALTLTAETPAESGFVKAEPTAATPVVPAAWSGGASLTLVSPNTVVLGFLQQDTPLGTVAGAAGTCHFAGAPPLLGHFAPGCPFHPTSSGGSPTTGSVATETLTLGSDERARLASLLPAVGGSQLVGFWSVRGGVTTTPLAFFTHLRLH
ncbi:MAG: hypothetical protein KY395_06770 [Actinobacteria bacterium]|nr:hypothetical protein [Actinomycetota bacterium]